MPQSSHGPTTTYSFNSSSGQELARRLLKPKVPFDLHDYQIEGTCAVLHGQDLLGCIPTGGGKTAFLFLPILLIHALHNDASLPAHVKKIYPRYPVMIAVFPTNSLELEKEKEFEAVGIRSLAINAQKLDEARKMGKNLWHDARDGVSIILLSPEQLISRAFEDLIQDPAFSARIFFIGVDEIQLLDIWGANFRKAFQQIGFIRARLPERIILIALTATLAK